jgi:hypothetical protein
MKSGLVMTRGIVVDRIVSPTKNMVIKGKIKLVSEVGTCSRSASVSLICSKSLIKGFPVASSKLISARSKFGEKFC